MQQLINNSSNIRFSTITTNNFHNNSQKTAILPEIGLVIQLFKNQIVEKTSFIIKMKYFLVQTITHVFKSDMLSLDDF